jgi:hypothetical protein
MLFIRQTFFLFQTLLFIAWIYMGIIEVEFDVFFVVYCVMSFVFGDWFFTRLVPCIGWFFDLIIWAFWPAILYLTYECLQLLPHNAKYFCCACMWIFWTAVFLSRYFWKLFKIIVYKEHRLW